VLFTKQITNECTLFVRCVVAGRCTLGGMQKCNWF